MSARPSAIACASVPSTGADVITGEQMRTRCACPIFFAIRCVSASAKPGVNQGLTRVPPTSAGRGSAKPLRSTSPSAQSSSKSIVNARASSGESAVTITFSCLDHESSVQLVEPVQSDSPSRTTNLWCIRSGTPAIARQGTPSAAPLLLVGEAAGYRGARVSGIPFTSERQLTGAGPAEATATIVRRVLAELGLEDSTLCWNVVPTHPHLPGRPETNRRPTRAEIDASRPFLRELARGRRAVAMGRLAHAVLGGAYVRHPSHGGATEFRDGLLRFAVGGQRVRRFSVAIVRPGTQSLAR